VKSTIPFRKIKQLEKKRINFIVTDLDDTIWDWLTMWYSSFHPYLERIARTFETDIDVLKKAFKTIHQKYGTAESSFIYDELTPLTQAQMKRIEETELGKKSILHEYYSNKKANLFLYPNVLETLKDIKSKGAKIVGFTESNSFFTMYRVKHLQLDGILDFVYAPQDPGLSDESYRHYDKGFWEPKITKFKFLDSGVRKPDPTILETILKDFHADKSNAIYIGDKLDRDIYMAQECGITSVWAEYGHQIDNAPYELLRSVTHWTDEDVQREIKFKKDFHLSKQPDYILKETFDELNEYFDFYTFDKN
jgi:FMN phosphatase YigB (HAD superfamily)